MEHYSTLTRERYSKSLDRTGTSKKSLLFVLGFTDTENRFELHLKSYDNIATIFILLELLFVAACCYGATPGKCTVFKSQFPRNTSQDMYM